MTTLNETLKLPSIRADLDKWLKKQPWAANSGFKNYYALVKLEKIVTTLLTYLSYDEAIKIVCDSAEGIIDELYGIKPLSTNSMYCE